MADRTWNRVQARLYDEWQLSKHARVILAHIIALSPNQYGVFDPSPYGRIREWWTGLITVEQFDSAWEELATAGKIKEFRDRDCLWLVKKFKHEQHEDLSSKQRQGVRNFIANYPEIEADFLSLYPMPFDTPLKPHTEGIATPSEGVRKGYDTSDPDPDPDPENKSVSDSGESEPPLLAPLEKTKPKRQRRIKAADLPAVEDLEQQLPAECLEPWKLFQLTVANSRDSKSVAPTVLAGMLHNFLRRTSTCTPAARAYGLLEAVKHNKPGEGYAATCAGGYQPGEFRGNGQQFAQIPEPPSRSVDEVLANQPVQISAELAAANDIPTLPAINLDDLPPPGDTP